MEDDGRGAEGRVLHDRARLPGADRGPRRGAAPRDRPLQGCGVRVAVVDLGTNTTRLLVADVVDGRVEEVTRRNTVTRLGENVDAGGELIEPAMERVFDAVAEYREAMDELGAERTVAVATSAVRDASNGHY